MTTAPSPSSVRDRFAAAADPLTRTIAAVPADRWNRPSPCEGWTAADVVEHIITTQRDFLQGRGLLPDPAAAASAADPSTGADPASQWAEHFGQVQAILDRPDVAGLTFAGFFGPTTVGDTLLRFYLPDMLVHRWDLASAVGGDTRLSEAELDDLEAAVDSWGDALYMDGICRPGVTAPPGADRQAVLLARMGRTSG